MKLILFIVALTITLPAVSQDEGNEPVTCCYKHKCVVTTEKKCSESGADAVALEGDASCAPFSPCGICCSLQGIIEFETRVDCLDRGGGSFYLGEVDKPTECFERKGVCCLYSGGRLDKSRSGVNIAISICGRDPNPALWILANDLDACPEFIPPNAGANLDSMDYILNVTAQYIDVNKEVIIEWLFDKDAEILGTYIERSRDGRTFKRIGYIEGNSNNVYSFADINPYLVGYYRLLAIKKGNKLSRSKIFHVVSAPKDELILQPNPATNFVRLLYINSQNHNSVVTLSTSNGKLLKKYTFRKGEIVQLGVSGLSSGLYFVKLHRFNSKTLSKRFYKN